MKIKQIPNESPLTHAAVMLTAQMILSSMNIDTRDLAVYNNARQYAVQSAIDLYNFTKQSLVVQHVTPGYVQRKNWLRRIFEAE